MASSRPNRRADYSKVKFVDGVRKTGLHLISKLRSDANLPYLYDPKESTGRKRQYDGKVKFNDLSRFDHVGQMDGFDIYTKVVNSVSLKRNKPHRLFSQSKRQEEESYLIIFN